MSFQDETEGRKRRKPGPDNETLASPRSPKKRAPSGEVGQALRSAYQRMVAEDIPPEMIDLLGKLG